MNREARSGYYYGFRQVIYVVIETPQHQPIKHVCVYGIPFKEVVKSVDRALAKDFGKTISNRPKGRPRKSSK